MIDPSALRKALIHALFTPEEIGLSAAPPADAVIVRGVQHRYGFHPDRLEEARPLIVATIQELAPSFRIDGPVAGGGWSFLNLPFDAKDQQWGEHENAEMLLVLALGLKLARYVLPRAMWHVLPGEVPYVVFRTDGAFETAEPGGH